MDSCSTLTNFWRFCIKKRKGARHFNFSGLGLLGRLHVVFLSADRSEIFCLQWRGGCREQFNVKIKMASTFSFINVNLLEFCDK